MSLQRASEFVDAEIKKLDTFSNTMCNSLWVNKLSSLSQSYTIWDERLSPYELFEYAQYVRELGSSMPWLSEMAFYFRRAEIVLSSKLQTSANWFFENAMVFSDKNAEAAQEWLLNYNGFQTIIPVHNIRLLEQKFDNLNVCRDGLLYLRTIPVYVSSVQAKAVLIFFIDQMTIQNSMEKFYISPQTETFLYNGKGETLYASAPEQADEIYKISVESDTPSNAVVWKDHYVFSVNSEYDSQWRYVMTVPRMVIDSANDGLRFLFMPIFLLILIAGILSGKLLKKVSVKPIESTVERIQNTLDLPRNGKDLKWLEQTINIINQQRAALLEQLNWVAPQALEYYLNKALSGQFTAHTFDIQLEFVGFRFPYPYFACAVCKAENRSMIEKLLDTRYLSGGLIIRFVTQEDLCCAICNVNDEEMFYHFVEDAVNITSPRFTVGIGSICNGFEQLHTSYLEAKKVLEYLLALDIHMVFSYDRIREQKNVYYFSASMEDKLNNLLQTGKHAEAISFIYEVLYRNIHEWNISLPALRCLLLVIDVIVSRTSTGQSFPIRIQEEIFYLQSLSKVLEHIEADVINTCASYSEREQKEALLCFIDENLADIGLSLDMVSQKFHYSPSYFSRWFKDRFGINFVKYVNHKRIEFAKDLLINSKESISTIAQSVGFSSDISFRRLFKEKEGITPGEYRKLSQSRKES